MIKIKINPQCAWGRDNEVRAYIEAIYNRQDKYGIEIDNIICRYSVRCQ